MSQSDELYQEIEDLKVEVVEFRELIEDHNEDEPRRKRLARVERIQIAIAVAVLTGYLTLQTSQQFLFSGPPTACFPDSGFHCAVSFQALYASAFLLTKLTTMTIRPVLDSHKYENELQQLDDYVLPLAYLPFLLGSVISGVGLLWMRNFQLPFFIVIYITVEAVLLYTVGRWYATQYSDTMAQIRSSSTDSTVTVTGGPSGSSTFFKIENTSDSVLSEGEVRFIVDSDNASVDIEQAVRDDSADSDRVWVYADELEPRKPQRIPISINPDDDSVKLRRVDITIEIKGEVNSTEQFEIFG